MGDYIVSNTKDNYNRGREGGGGSNYIDRDVNPVWTDKLFSKKKEDIRNWVAFVIDNIDRSKRDEFNIELLELINDIEVKHPKKNRFTIILCMCFCVQFASHSFDRYGKEKLNIFLKNTWKEIRYVISSCEKNTEKTLRDRNMLVHLQIYKANIVAGSDAISRYVAIWEQALYMFIMKKQNNKRELSSGNVIERVDSIGEYAIVKTVNYLDVIYDIKANNGRNACYINTVLFLWSCNPVLRHLMVYNRFFDQNTSHEIQSMLSHKWGDSLYIKYFNLFKRENLMDIPNHYGQFSHPHTIINFMCESIFKNSGMDFSVDVDSIYNLSTFSEFQDFLRRNRKNKQLLGIIKTVERIPIDLPLNDIRREQCGFHYVSFYMLRPNQYILFDALEDGTVAGSTQSEEKVFTFNYPDRPKVQGAYTFFFIWLKKKI